MVLTVHLTTTNGTTWRENYKCRVCHALLAQRNYLLSVPMDVIVSIAYAHTTDIWQQFNGCKHDIITCLFMLKCWVSNRYRNRGENAERKRTIKILIFEVTHIESKNNRARRSSISDVITKSWFKLISGCQFCIYFKLAK